ncbi:MAG: LapA family protein [Acidimicrobiales bacterium]
MPREPTKGSQTEELDPKARRRKQNPARTVVVLVVLAAAIAFVIQNRQSVPVRLWVVTEHVHLIWLVLVCVVLGGLADFVIRRTVRVRRRSRRRRPS